jgi:hypothetical protein
MSGALTRKTAKITPWLFLGSCTDLKASFPTAPLDAQILIMSGGNRSIETTTHHTPHALALALALSLSLSITGPRRGGGRR